MELGIDNCGVEYLFEEVNPWVSPQETSDRSLV